MTVPFARSYMIWEDFWGIGTPEPPRPNTSRVFQLPGWMPDPCFIIGANFLAETNLTSGLNNRPILLNDPKATYIKAAWGKPAEPNSPHDTPLSAPLCMWELHRIAWMDMQPTVFPRFGISSHTPWVRNSRSEGDMLYYDHAGTPASVWFALSLIYADAASIGQAPPPALAYGVGPWGSLSANTGTAQSPYWGRTIQPGNIGKSKLAMKFVAPAAGEISSIRFRVTHLRIQDHIICRLYADNAGSPGAAIGNGSWDWNIGAVGVQEPQWPIGCGAVTQAGGTYWIGIEPVNGTLDCDVDTCPPYASFASGRGDVMTNITSNLPGTELWRMQIAAVIPAA